MEIVIDRQPHLTVDVQWEIPRRPSLQKALPHILQGLKSPGPGELSLYLIDDEKMRQLNLQYRALPSTTDVLCFPVHPDLQQWPTHLPLVGLGDIMISVPRAQKQAREHGISLPQEVAHLLAHGFLHLLGLDHGEEMSRREAQLVENMYRKCGWESA